MKKMLTVLMTLAIVLSLAACGGKAPSSGDAGGSLSPAGGSGAAPAGDDTYYIGMYASQTGTSASVGENQIRGAQLAVQEINASGGILGGRPIELIVYDDASSTEMAVKVVTRLVEDDKVDVILGGNMSPNILASLPVTEDAHVLHIGAGTGTTWTNIGCKYLYRATVSGVLPTETFIEMMQEMGETTAAMLSLEAEYGQSGRLNVLEVLKETDIQLVADVTYQSTDTDYTGHIAKLLKDDPGSIIHYGYSSEMAVFLKQLRQAGYEGCVYTVEGGGDRQLSQIAGAAADGVVFSAAYVIPEEIGDATSELEAAYLTNFVDTYGEMPTSDCAYRGYDEVYLACAVLDASADPADREANREAILSTKFTGLAGTFDFSDGSGDGLSSANKYMLMDQKVKGFDRDAMMDWRDNK